MLKKPKVGKDGKLKQESESGASSSDGEAAAEAKYHKKLMKYHGISHKESPLEHYNRIQKENAEYEDKKK